MTQQELLSQLRAWQHAHTGTDLPARLAYVEEQMATMRELLAQAANEIERLTNATANPVTSPPSPANGDQA